jgi:hypothetical protein
MGVRDGGEAKRDVFCYHLICNATLKRWFLLLLVFFSSHGANAPSFAALLSSSSTLSRKPASWSRIAYDRFTLPPPPPALLALVSSALPAAAADST